MQAEHAIELRVPADDAFASLVRTVVYDAAARAEIDAAQQSKIAAAAHLGFELIVRDAMARAREPLSIIARWTPADLRISLRERGLPLDDAAARRDPHWVDILTCVDDAHWILHGHAGSELRLIVKRPHGIAHRAEPPPPPDSVPLAPEQTYTVRRFRAEDAPGVARAFYLTWGYHYILPAVYVPKRLIAMNAANTYISMVAAGEDGEIVGHYALDPIAETPIADGCAAIVVPAHRGRGLLERLRRAAEDEAVRLGFAGYYSEPVTTHTRTQTDSAKFGAHLCAIVLGGDPATFVPQHMQYAGAGQRQSYTIYIKPLKARERRAIYPPPAHREIVEKIYAQVGLPVDVRSGSPATGDGELHVDVSRSEGTATMNVIAAGGATAQQIAQAVSDLRALRHLGAVYVNLPLEDPGTPALCDCVESLGFFFCGVVPWVLRGRDALRLQLPLTPIDLSQVAIAGDFGNELKGYITAAYRSRK